MRVIALAALPMKLHETERNAAPTIVRSRTPTPKVMLVLLMRDLFLGAG